MSLRERTRPRAGHYRTVSVFIEMVTLAGLEPATSPVPRRNKDALSPLELQRRHDLHGRSWRHGAEEYRLLLDFDCAGGGRPTFFAGIGQVAQVRIV
jgi:hypothetical protein